MSLPQPIRAARAEIDENILRGAHDLARQAVVAFGEVLEEVDPAVDPASLCDTLRVSAASLARTRPAMSAIGNASAELFKEIEAELFAAKAPIAAAREVVASYLVSLDEAMLEASRRAAEVVPEGAVVMTISFSKTALEGLLLTEPRKIIVAESRPALEGRITATRLAEGGKTVEVVSDAAAPSLVREATMVLFGADAVLADGAVVNKVGSHPIAKAAREASVPVYAACEALKISPLHSMPPDDHPGFELWDAPPTGVTVRNPYFELLPRKLITGIITEQGTMDVDDAAHIAASRRAALRAIGINY